MLTALVVRLYVPVPLLNLVSDLNKGRPPMADTYVPLPLLSQAKPSAVLPVNARSVPCSRVTYLQRHCHSARSGVQAHVAHQALVAAYQGMFTP